MTNHSEFTRILNSREPFDFIDMVWFLPVVVIAVVAFNGYLVWLFV
jgi:nitrate reductase NapE component